MTICRICVGLHRGQLRTSDTSELELQAVCCLMWGLGIASGSFGGEASIRKFSLHLRNACCYKRRGRDLSP